MTQEEKTENVYNVGFCSQEKNKTLRVGLVNATMATCLPLGTGISGILYREVGFNGVYALALVLCFVSVWMAHLSVHDVKVVKSESDKSLKESYWTQLKYFFNLKHVFHAFKVTFKRGENNRRMKIIALTVLISGVMGPLQGKFFYKFVFVHVQYIMIN